MAHPYRTRRPSALARVTLLVGIALLGCARPPQTTPAETRAAAGFPLTLQSSDGRSLTLPRPAQRIVSLSPGHTEILFAIGAGAAVAGADRFSDYPEATQSLPKVDYTNPNIEALVAMRPDLVIASTRQRTQVPAFEAARLTVVLLEEPSTVREVVERVRMLGRITGQTGAAEQLSTAMEARITAITDRLAPISAGPRVYHEIDPKLYSAGPESFVGDLYTLLKAQNIAQGAATSFPQLTAEAILAADPEVIILADSRFPGGSPEEARARPGWNTLAAVRTGRVYAVEDDLVSRPGPRIVDGIEQLARVLYPALFP